MRERISARSRELFVTQKNPAHETVLLLFLNGFCEAIFALKKFVRRWTTVIPPV